MTEILEVELPGSGSAILDGGAELLFRQEFEAALVACGDYSDITTAELRAELARRPGCQSHGRSASG